MLQRDDELLIHARHRLVRRQTRQLLAEGLLLQDRVTQLGVGVGQLHPVDVQFEALGHRWVVALALGEWA